MAENKKKNTQDKKRMLFYRGIFVVLFIFFIAGVAYGGYDILLHEGVMPEDTLEQPSLTPLSSDASAQEIIDYLNSVLQKAENDKPKMTRSTSFSIPEDSISFSKSGEIASALALYAKDKILPELNSRVKGLTLDFGEDYGSTLYIPDLFAIDIKSSSISDMKKGDDGIEKKVDTYSFELKFSDETAPLSASSPISRNFSPRDNNEINQLIGNAFDEFCQIDKMEIAYKNCLINGSVNRLNNKIDSLNLIKRMQITADITLIGDLKEVGNLQCSFILQENTSFSFVWPHIKMSKSELSMEKNDTMNLLAYMSWNDGSKVSWSSSDESIATVDESGYIKSHKNGEAIISAAAEFQGVSYVAQCKVNVKISVNGVRASRRKLELKVGEQETLQAEVSPKKATITTVKWYSENESIASVDMLSGLIEAKSQGTVKIYALTDDGRYKSTCTLSVTG